MSFEEAKPGVTTRWTGPSVAQGPISQTGQPLDLAIAGDGWFQLRRPDGQVGLTRAGSFRLDGAIEQGALEGSTADLTESSVGMIVGQAGFTANVRSLATQDETLRTLIDAFR